MATITYIDPPKIPYGFDEKFIDYSALNLPANKVLAHVATRARPEGDYLAKGIDIETNRGQPLSTSIPNGRKVYFGDVSDIRNATGGSKPFNQYTQSEVNQIVANVTSRYSNGLLLALDEAQENEGPWRCQSDYAPQQIKWLNQAWKVYADAHPEFQGFYSNYSGSLNTIVFRSSSDIALGLSSPSQARAFVSDGRSEFYTTRYWTQEYWRYRPPLLNLYIHQLSSLHNVMAEAVLSIKMYQLALADIGRDSRDMLVFMWADSSSGLQGSYTERHIRNVVGGTLFSYGFPGWDAESMVQISYLAFQHGRHVFNWLDTYLNGTDTSLVPPDVVRDDGFVYARYEGTGATKTASYYNPSPYRPATTTYPCASVPHGGHDHAALGAWWYGQARAIVNAEPQPIAWRQNNESFMDTTPSVYWIKTWTEQRAWVEAAVNGGTVALSIYDVCGKYCVKGRGTLDINVGGTVVTVNYYQGVMNLIKIIL